MNAERRKRIAQAQKLMSDARDILEDVKAEEEEARDNLPDAFRDGERGDAMERHVEALQDMIDALDEHRDYEFDG